MKQAIGKVFLLLTILVVTCGVRAQEAVSPADPPEVRDAEQPAPIKLREFENIVTAKLREQFPRFFFSSIYSVHLPDYGPLVSVTIQPPSFFFTNDLMRILGEQQKRAEADARKFQEHIDRQAQLIRLKVKEADLMNMIESSGKKKAKSVQSLQQELETVRKSMQELEEATQNVSFQDSSVTESDRRLDNTEVDLNSIVRSNYQALITRVTTTVKSLLAQNAVGLEMDDQERVSISTYVRDNYMGNPERRLVFSLKSEDIRAFREGSLDTKGLQERIQITEE